MGTGFGTLGIFQDSAAILPLGFLSGTFSVMEVVELVWAWYCSAAHNPSEFNPILFDCTTTLFFEDARQQRVVSPLAKLLQHQMLGRFHRFAQSSVIP